MKQVNYAEMSDQELKHYLVKHRDDQAFHAYLDRQQARSSKTSIEWDDPNWQEKVVAVIQEQLNAIKDEKRALLNLGMNCPHPQPFSPGRREQDFLIPSPSGRGLGSVLKPLESIDLSYERIRL